MSVRRTIPEYDGIYFITFTCWKWLKLFEISNAHSAIYKWFDVLKAQGHYITGYVIMPNHIHALLAFSNTQGVSINAIVGNGKRFIAYEIIKNLKTLKNYELLYQLEKGVTKKDAY
ncbi:MAG: transposase [Cyclobacteriaceae bacterium]